MRTRLRLTMQPQPNDFTCGPTCLHSVYQYYQHNIGLDQVISEVEHLEGGGTLAVLLANHALKQGFRATIYTYNLQVFDPSWFQNPLQLQNKLRQQMAAKQEIPKLTFASQAYLEFLNLGGRLRFDDLRPTLIRRYLNLGIPILTGTSATYLYHCQREWNNTYDDIKGEPSGHFVVLCGYDRVEREVSVADPWRPNPVNPDKLYYSVDIDRLVGAILLGILTYDANLLIIEPKEATPPKRRSKR